MQTLKIHGCEVDYYAPSEAVPTLFPEVCIPGTWGNSKGFQQTAEYLSRKGHPVWVPNLRGYGGSVWSGVDPGKVTMGDYVSDMQNLISHIGEPVGLLGHSMGGLIAQAVAIKNPHVRAIALMGSAPPRGVPLIGPVTLRGMKYLPKMVFGKSFLPTRKDYQDLVLNNLPEREWEEAYDELLPASGWAALQNLFGAVRVRPEDIKCPILAVCGRFDRMIPLSVQQKTAKYLGAKERVVGHGHKYPKEAGYFSTLEYIAQWFSSC